jgi:hypothetical protein
MHIEVSVGEYPCVLIENQACVKRLVAAQLSTLSLHQHSIPKNREATGSTVLVLGMSLQRTIGANPQNRKKKDNSRERNKFHNLFTSPVCERR